MRFASYFYASVVAALSIVAYAVYTKEQFYPTILFLVTSKVSFVVMGNMIIATAFLLGRVSKSVFLGSLRDVEVELLIERSKYTFTETCLALTIFRNELSPAILALFGALLFLKAFHWLSSSRIDYLEQVMPVAVLTHLRLLLLIIALAVVDVWMTVKCINHTITNGRSVMILFGFEFGLLIVSIFSIISRYVLHVIDSRLTAGLAAKGLYIMLVDLICDAMRFVTYVFFFCLVFVYYGLPIHIIREVWMAFYAFQKRLSSFIKYLRLTRNLDQRFESATEEELAAAGDCLICREAMERGKKLPCSHVFHLDCLRMWLQHQQSCPLCRADIPVSQTAADDVHADAAAAAAEARAAAEEAAPDGEVAAAVGGGGVGDAAVPEAGRGVAGGMNDIAAGAAAGGAGISGVNNIILNLGMDNPELRQHQLLAGFPKFFLVVREPNVEIKTEPKTTSTTVRAIAHGTVVFVLARVEGTDAGHWLQLADGWVRERTFLLGALGPPHLVPYDPATDDSEIAAAGGAVAGGGGVGARGAAVTPAATTTAVNNRSAALAAELANLFARPAVSANATTTAAARAPTATAAGAQTATPTPPPFSAFIGAASPTAPGLRTTSSSSFTAGAAAGGGGTAAQASFGPPYGIQRPGEGWGVGTTLDRMIGVQEQLHTLQSGVQTLYLAMEMMQESIMNCETSLAELLNDQVKQYERVHDLRQHVAEGRHLVEALALAHRTGRVGRDEARTRAEALLQAQADLVNDLPIRAVEGGPRIPPGRATYFTAPPPAPAPAFHHHHPAAAVQYFSASVPDDDDDDGDVHADAEGGGEGEGEDVFEDIEDDDEGEEGGVGRGDAGQFASSAAQQEEQKERSTTATKNKNKETKTQQSSSSAGGSSSPAARGTSGRRSGGSVLFPDNNDDDDDDRHNSSAAWSKTNNTSSSSAAAGIDIEGSRTTSGVPQTMPVAAAASKASVDIATSLAASASPAAKAGVSHDTSTSTSTTVSPAAATVSATAPGSVDRTATTAATSTFDDSPRIENNNSISSITSGRGDDGDGSSSSSSSSSIREMRARYFETKIAASPPSQQGQQQQQQQQQREDSDVDNAISSEGGGARLGLTVGVPSDNHATVVVAAAASNSVVTASCLTANAISSSSTPADATDVITEAEAVER